MNGKRVYIEQVTAIKRSPPHLLRQLRHGERAVLLGAARRQRGEAVHEEMKTRERDHVDGELANCCFFQLQYSSMRNPHSEAHGKYIGMGAQD